VEELGVKWNRAGGTIREATRCIGLEREVLTRKSVCWGWDWAAELVTKVDGQVELL
jgi:hypothetical protein